MSYSQFIGQKHHVRGEGFLNNDSIEKGYFLLNRGQVGLDPHDLRFLNFSFGEIKNFNISFLLVLGI